MEFKSNPTIAVYAIFKDEEKFAERFLSSCINADEIILCNTGSIDKTVERLERVTNHFKAWSKVLIERIYVSPWRFDDARNAALSLVSPDIDICISLDFDEYLMPDWKEEFFKNYDPMATRYYHRFTSYWKPPAKSEHWHDRIHVRHGYKWQLPVHEILENYEKEESVIWLPNFHMYQTQDMEKPRSSYLPLLEISVRERPNVWKSWTFLATEYQKLNRLDDALKALDTAMSLEDSDKAYISSYKASMLFDIGKYNESIASARTTILYNNIREYNVYLAELYEKLYHIDKLPQNKKLAKQSIISAEEITEKPSNYAYNENCWNENFITTKTRIMNL